MHFYWPQFQLLEINWNSPLEQSVLQTGRVRDRSLAILTAASRLLLIELLTSLAKMGLNIFNHPNLNLLSVTSSRPPPNPMHNLFVGSTPKLIIELQRQATKWMADVIKSSYPAPPTLALILESRWIRKEGNLRNQSQGASAWYLASPSRTVAFSFCRPGTH